MDAFQYYIPMAGTFSGPCRRSVPWAETQSEQPHDVQLQKQGEGRLYSFQHMDPAPGPTWIVRDNEKFSSKFIPQGLLKYGADVSLPPFFNIIAIEGTNYRILYNCIRHTRFQDG